MLIWVILITTTILYSQNDTTRCFGIQDLKKIAIKIETGQECCDIVSIQDSIILNDHNIIATKDSIISSEKRIIEAGHGVVVKQGQEIQECNLYLEKSKKALIKAEKWRKVERILYGVGGFILGSAVGAGITYIITK